MSKFKLIIMLGIMICVAAPSSWAEEKGSMKGSGSEHKGSGPGMHDLKVTKKDMQDVMKAYIDTNAAEHDGAFEIEDVQTGETRRLSFVAMHEKLSMAGTHHYSCADFKDLDSGEVVDVDIYVDMTDEGLKAMGAEIHKVDGEPRHIYEGHSQMPADDIHMKMQKGSSSEMKGSGSEHKGSMKGSESDM